MSIRTQSAQNITVQAPEAEPIFKSIFGKCWDELPPVMKKHYANRPYTKDSQAVKGVLDVICKPPLTFFAPLMKFLGQIPARTASRVPVVVHFESDPDSNSFAFNRVFYFSTGPYRFQSRMIPIKGDEVAEVMRFGFSWKLRYAWDGEKVVLTHRGYALKISNYFIPLPFTLLLGAGYAEERAVDENTFDMAVHISHPWWGKIYEYKGRFEVTQ